MTPISEQDLILLYYGEHDDPDLAGRVAESDQLRAQFAALSHDLDQIEQLNRSDASDQVIAERIWSGVRQQLPASNLVTLSSAAVASPSMTTPRAIMAWGFAAAALVVVSVLISVSVMRHYPTADPSTQGLASNAGAMDQGLIFTRALQQHLQSTDVLLTRLVNHETDPPHDQMLKNASGLLAQNRIYRQLASQQGDDRINALLSELEPLLLELANELQTGPDRATRLQSEQDLLFKVRVMDQQLSMNQGESNAI